MQNILELRRLLWTWFQNRARRRGASSAPLAWKQKSVGSKTEKNINCLLIPRHLKLWPLFSVGSLLNPPKYSFTSYKSAIAFLQCTVDLKLRKSNGQNCWPRWRGNALAPAFCSVKMSFMQNYDRRCMMTSALENGWHTTCYFFRCGTAPWYQIMSPILNNKRLSEQWKHWEERTSFPGPVSLVSW